MVQLLQAMKGKSLQEFPVPPFTKWLNGELLSVERGHLAIQFTVRPEMANPTGLLHGGMQGAMIDDTIGMVSATLGYKGFLLSIDMHVDYLGKVRVGENIIATGRIIREGRRVVHASVKLETGDGKLVAEGRSNLLITSHEPDFLKQVDG